MNQQQLDWYNEGVIMLMALMNGRGIVARGSAERKVFEQWRMRGHLIDQLTEDTCTHSAS
jgi:hypothetical protein